MWQPKSSICNNFFVYFLPVLIIFLSTSGLLEGTSSQTCSQNELPSLSIVKDKVNMSGFSSGGSFAHQLQIAYSTIFGGIAVFAPAFYACPYPFLPTDQNTSLARTERNRGRCSLGESSVNSSIELARNLSSQGKIDTSCLGSARVYVYIATNDELAVRSVRENVATVYRALGTPATNIGIITRVSNHHFPTDNSSQASCDQSIYVSLVANLLTRGKLGTSGCAYCNYSGAFEGLQYIYKGSLVRPSGDETLGPLETFNQCIYAKQANCSQECGDLDCTGYIYTPAACRNGGGPCGFLIIFHGSYGSRSQIDTDFPVQSEFLRVCEVNRLVCLFPQAKEIANTNSDGAFDIVGYTSFKDYLTKDACQMKTIVKMIEAITGRKEEDFACAVQ